MLKIHNDKKIILWLTRYRFKRKKYRYSVNLKFYQWLFVKFALMNIKLEIKYIIFI